MYFSGLYSKCISYVFQIRSAARCRLVWMSSEHGAQNESFCAVKHSRYVFMPVLFVSYRTFTTLKFSEPTVTIEANDGRIHAHQGTDVEFKCLIRGMLQKPAYVFWYVFLTLIWSHSIQSSLRAGTKQTIWGRMGNLSENLCLCVSCPFLAELYLPLNTQEYRISNISRFDVLLLLCIEKERNFFSISRLGSVTWLGVILNVG